MYDQHIILDFEMNPIEKENHDVYIHLRSEIIEIGAVRLNSDFELTDRFSYMIRPENNAAIDLHITDLTGIKTPDAFAAESFENAIAAFTKWIGAGKTRIYAWGEADLAQLAAECTYKNIAFPENMRRWCNFQFVYPRIMRIHPKRRKLALSTAAEQFGIIVDAEKAHRALYDAEVTAEIVMSILTGKYIEQKALLHGAMKDDSSHMTQSLGDSCAAALARFMQQFAEG